MKAILVIDDIPESIFAENISIEYKLIYYPDGHLKELGIHGKQLLKPMPKELDPGISDDYVNYCQGFNDCLDEILGEEEKTL